MTQLTKNQEHWLHHIQSADQSGLSYAGYCKKHSISANALYNGKTKLLKLGAVNTVKSKKTLSRNKTPFMQTQMRPSSQAVRSLTKDTLSIYFPSGAELSVPADPQLIEQLTQWVLQR